MDHFISLALGKVRIVLFSAFFLTFAKNLPIAYRYYVYGMHCCGRDGLAGLGGFGGFAGSYEFILLNDTQILPKFENNSGSNGQNGIQVHPCVTKKLLLVFQQKLVELGDTNIE